MKKRRYWPEMVPGKEMEDKFGEVKVRKTYSIQGTVDDVICNLWKVKKPNYVMRMMATSGRLLADDTFMETVIRQKENGEDVLK